LKYNFSTPEPTSLLTLEIGRGCDMAKDHDRCPSADLDRYGNLPQGEHLPDDLVIEIIVKAYKEMQFKGKVAFHYYNEPLMYAKRLFSIVKKVRELVPESEFFLNTNGTYVDKNLENLHYFKMIVLSNYYKKNWDYIKPYLVKDCHLWVQSGDLDARKNNFKDFKEMTPCGRPYKEFIIDVYGNGHLCCMDWKGEVNLGNVKTIGFEQVFYNFAKIREKVSTDGERLMDGDAPLICKMCNGKTRNRKV